MCPRRRILFFGIGYWGQQIIASVVAFGCGSISFHDSRPHTFTRQDLIDRFDNAYTATLNVEHVRRKPVADATPEDEFEDIDVTTRLLELQSVLLSKTDSMESQAD